MKSCVQLGFSFTPARDLKRRWSENAHIDNEVNENEAANLAVGKQQVRATKIET